MRSFNSLSQSYPFHSKFDIDILRLQELVTPSSTVDKMRYVRLNLEMVLESSQGRMHALSHRKADHCVQHLSSLLSNLEAKELHQECMKAAYRPDEEAALTD